MKYIPIKYKFAFTTVLIVLWLIFAGWLGYLWYLNIVPFIPKWLAAIIVILLAILPAINTGMVVCGSLFDKQRHYFDENEPLPDITVLIAAHNEEKTLVDTLTYLNNSTYKGNIHTFIVDNCSSDNTYGTAVESIPYFDKLDIHVFNEPNPGKFNALNSALPSIQTKYVVTLDADTALLKHSLAALVSHMVHEDNGRKKIGAVAGDILVRNSRHNLLTKLQEWEYFLCIAGIKRSQGLFQSTLVAQGAFSIYNTELLRKIGGWPDAIGEDILLTWNIMAEGYCSQFEPDAVAFTNVPTNYFVFFKQRARWARGLIEGLRSRPFWKYPKFYTKVHILQDWLLPFIDIGVIFFWVPGLIAAIGWGNHLIVGPRTLLMLPITLILLSVLLIKQRNNVFKPFNLRIRKHYLSFVIFLFTWNILVAPAAIVGYFQEIFNLKRIWK